MSKLTYKVSYYALYVMFAAIILVLLLFYLGGDAQGNAVLMGVDPDMWQPARTDAMLWLIYVMIGLAVACTLVAAFFQFAAALKDNPASAIRSLLGLILLAAVMVVSWFLGSDKVMNIPGYEGTDNVPFWLQFSDMFIYAIYFLLGATIVAIIGSSIMKKLS